MKTRLTSCAMGLVAAFAVGCGSSSHDSQPTMASAPAASEADGAGSHDTMGAHETPDYRETNTAVNAPTGTTAPTPPGSGAAATPPSTFGDEHPSAVGNEHAAIGDPSAMKKNPSAMSNDGSEEETVVAMVVLEPVGGKKSKKSKNADEVMKDDGATSGDMELDDSVIGKVELKQEGDTVTISGSFHKLDPGMHGFVIRADGSCSASRRAKHFNPTDAKHGPPSSRERHAGDLGNIMVAKDGTATFELKTDSFTVAEGHSSVKGKALVVMRGQDAGKASNAYGAGPAIACGVIKVAGEGEPVAASR